MEEGWTVCILTFYGDSERCQEYLYACPFEEKLQPEGIPDALTLASLRRYLPEEMRNPQTFKCERLQIQLVWCSHRVVTYESLIKLRGPPMGSLSPPNAFWSHL